MRQKIAQLRASNKEQVMIRVRLETDGFSIMSAYIQPDTIKKGNVPAVAHINEELNFDLASLSRLKVSLHVITGQELQSRPLIAQYVTSSEMGFGYLKLGDFPEDQGSFIQMPLNGKEYNSKISEQDHIVLDIAFSFGQVPGYTKSLPLSGNKLLIGKFAIYNKFETVKVLEVNLDQTCTIQKVNTFDSVKEG